MGRVSISIAIINCGWGNLQSIYKKLSELKAIPVVAISADQVKNADKILLPGVGHFETAMRHLKEVGIYDSLNEAVLIQKKQILGICLGMEMMAKKSEEGNATGFGWLDTCVIKFKVKDKVRYKVPHTGWNTVDICKESSLFKNIKDHSEFYFLHSYHFDRIGQNDIAAKTEYEYDFVSVVEKENIFATQFHPEKSHCAGIELLKNFIRI